MVDISMNYKINQTSKFHIQSEIFLGYVDDLFCVFKSKTDLEKFFNHINSIHPNIQFTKELKEHNQLAYLDVLITRKETKLGTKVYRKQTNTEFYLKWSSLFPIKYKRNFVNCLLDRAYRITPTMYAH